MTLAQVTDVLAKRIAKDVRVTRRVFVAIDGPDCSGKTTLCNSVVTSLKDRHTILPVHFDDYLNSERVRQRRGRCSPRAFLWDFFDAGALVRSVLEPMKRSATEVSPAPIIVIVEGLFLLSKDLAPLFDLRIRLEISDSLLLDRALARDSGRLGSEAWVRTHYLRQCLPAQRIYRREAQPAKRAHFLISVIGDDRYDIRR